MPELISSRVTLRPAVPEDCRRLWEWRIEQATREASFNTEYVPFEEHERWFARKLTDRHICTLIVMNTDGYDVGCVRFSIVGEEAEISVNIVRAERGKGYGATAIKSGSDYLLTTEPVQRIVAYIKRGNSASMVAFKQAGFILRGYKQIAGVEACEMVYEGKANDHGSAINKSTLSG